MLQNLTEKRRTRLDHGLEAVRAYLLKESLRALCKYTPHWAGCFLDGCLKRAPCSRLDPISTVARNTRAPEAVEIALYHPAGRVTVRKPPTNSAKGTATVSHTGTHTTLS